MQIDKYLLTDFRWEPGKGLMKGEGKKEKHIANAAPIVISRINIDDHTTNSSKKVVRLQYMDCYG